MQNNVTELTQRLLRALDSNYNVINMPEVVEIISHLEKVAITKELLETTRLGKHVNELRRKTTDQELSRTAKELLKKWRGMVLPETNGQIKQPVQTAQQQQPRNSSRASTPNELSPPLQGVRPPRISPGGTPKKVSPPPKTVSPALQSRLAAAPPLQKLVSPQQQQQQQQQRRLASPKLASPSRMASPKLPPGVDLIAAAATTTTTSPPLIGADVNLNQVKQGKKRPHGGDGAAVDAMNAKRSRLNGGVADLDVSDSSNSCFLDVNSGSATPLNPEAKRPDDVIVVNSDSNSSLPDKLAADDLLSSDNSQIPKKRGRKKGSKNHRNLIDEAETSFTNKLAVSASRGSSKVKTTQEILAGIQNKNTVAALSAAAGIARPSFEDLEEKAAKLTERVSMIDRKLNANCSRNKNSQKNKLGLGAATKNERVIESGSVINDKSLLDRLRREEPDEDEEDEDEDEEEIVVVDEVATAGGKEGRELEGLRGTEEQPFIGVKSLSEEDALAQLPPVDRSVLDEPSPEPPCTCRLQENNDATAVRKFASDFSIGGDEEEEAERGEGDSQPPPPPPFAMIEDPACPARQYLDRKYRVHDVSEEKILRLHESLLPNVNGNWSLGTARPEAPGGVGDRTGLYANVVPNIYERLDKDAKPFDSFKKYSVSEGDTAAKSDPDDVIIEDPNVDTGPNVNGGPAAVDADSRDSDEKISVINAVNSELKNCAKSDMKDRTTASTVTEQLEVFREWYECVDTPSYNGDTLRILPYCIVD